MADRLDPPELLGVDVEQLARPFALVAHDRRPRLEGGQLAEPQAAQTATDRRDRHRQLARDRGAAQALAPPVLDLGHARGGHLMGAAAGARTAVHQRRRTAGAVAREPAVRLPLRQSAALAAAATGQPWSKTRCTSRS